MQLRYPNLSVLLVLLVPLVLLPGITRSEVAIWKAGVATVAITPKQSMWLAGYASRTKPSEGVLSELNAKALAIEDQAGTRAVVVTTDLISIPRALRLQVVQEIETRYKLKPAGVLLNCSHTHCSPVVRDDLEMSVMYPLEPEQRQRVESYFLNCVTN